MTSQPWLFIAGSIVLMAVAAATGGQSTSNGDSPRLTALRLEEQGSLREAEVAWRAIVEAHPNDAEAHAHIGLLEAHQAHYQEAISYDRRSLTNGD